MNKNDLKIKISKRTSPIEDSTRETCVDVVLLQESSAFCQPVREREKERERERERKRKREREKEREREKVTDWENQRMLHFLCCQCNTVGIDWDWQAAYVGVNVSKCMTWSALHIWQALALFHFGSIGSPYYISSSVWLVIQTYLPVPRHSQIGRVQCKLCMLRGGMLPTCLSNVSPPRRFVMIWSFSMLSTTAESKHVYKASMRITSCPLRQNACTSITSATPAMYACHCRGSLFCVSSGSFHRVGTSPNLKTVRSSTVSG